MKFWAIVYRVAGAAFAVLLIVGLISLFIPKIRQNRERQRTIARLEAEIRARDDAARHLQRQQELFENDPRFVEQVAREELGKARPGETIFRFTETNEHRRAPAADGDRRRP